MCWRLFLGPCWAVVQASRRAARRTSRRDLLLRSVPVSRTGCMSMVVNSKTCRRCHVSIRSYLDQQLAWPATQMLSNALPACLLLSSQSRLASLSLSLSSLLVLLCRPLQLHRNPLLLAARVDIEPLQRNVELLQGDETCGVYAQCPRPGQSDSVRLSGSQVQAGEVGGLSVRV